ncbi:YbaK/EbsC family protein [Limnochorda pilosa]|uniref:YbaK/aminoacyl-tRNA synthetase-associated domain-containing protein n=1 Tax=Limnochorda pilosa TaxID=1555112 RepID=A0A0K2SHG7_LIMPI|nr:YbaK/EbsC family protein [Limnochorda pilosa]BAS26561.1 hypothetical protein LIP_0704 [Limnochorda pilosa]
MKEAAQRVQRALRAAGIEAEITEFPQGTRTAAEAAAAIGTDVARIVKSLVFMAGDVPVLVLTSGANRVDEGKLARLTGQAVRRATAGEVREATGFAIGGTPPVGHAQPIPVLADQDLLQHEIVWAAAGTPQTVFPIAPKRLVEITGGRVTDVKEDR